ncbi:MAG: carbohydrate ABC transporter permease [Ostreibacterium sp.]
MNIQGINRLTPYYFILPAMIIMAVGLFYPVAYSVYTSFFDLRMGSAVSTATFVGWDNYRDLWHDDAARESLLVTLFFATVVVTSEVTLGVALALVLDRKIKGMGFIRTIFILPMMIAPIVVGLIWRYLYHPDVGPINRLLSQLGIGDIPWLSSPHWALWSVIIADIWQWTPFIFILCLAALQSLPSSVIEAASIDGASRWQSTWYIKIPLMMPVIIVALLLRLIDAFKVLEVIFIMTNGGPGLSTEILSLRIYKEAFVSYQLGRASALSNMLLLLIACISILIMVVQHLRKRYQQNVAKLQAQEEKQSCQ